MLSEIEEVGNSNRSIEDIVIKQSNRQKTLLEDVQIPSIKIPESVNMDAQIPFLNNQNN